MGKMTKILIVGLLSISMIGCSTNKKTSETEEDRSNYKIVSNANTKLSELQNYHMVTNADGKTFDVNMENIDGDTNMAGTQTYDAPIYSHSDFSEVGKETVTEYIYVKGGASMSYRTRDGITQTDVSFANLILSTKISLSINEKIQYLDAEEKNSEYVKNTTIETKEDGSKTVTFASTQEVFEISSEGYLLSYNGQDANFVIDNLNGAVLDYTYCSI